MTKEFGSSVFNKQLSYKSKNLSILPANSKQIGCKKVGVEYLGFEKFIIMPGEKKPLIKNWDKPKTLRHIKPSRYEKNEPSVKLHWKNVVKKMELSFKDDKFWESQSKTVRELVGPVIFPRIIKIFDLPPEPIKYEAISESASIEASEKFHVEKKFSEYQQKAARPDYSMSEFASLEEEEEVDEEQVGEEDDWSKDSQTESSPSKLRSTHKSLVRKRSRAASILASRNFSRMVSSKSFSHRAVSVQSIKSRRGKSEVTITESPANSYDDMDVHLASIYGIKRRYDSRNPHFDILYCNESETDMIKWNSKYKQKAFEVSASDEFSKKAEIMSKKIAKEFYDWWTNLGSSEFKSEIKRPEDIEDLFQVWFDEHASRSLVLDPKILPCVLHSIAKFVGVPYASCPRVLKRQIAYDIKAETSPAHTTAFNTPLPQKLKHVPPRNNTKDMWRCVKIPEDLRTMGAVWEDVQHLTSTKAFYKWLQKRPYLSMPPILEGLDAPGDKKQLFVVPSDYISKDKEPETGEPIKEGLAFPVSKFTLEIKEVLSKLMN